MSLLIAKRGAGLGSLLLGAALILTGCGSDGPKITSPHAAIVTEGASLVHKGDTVTIGSMFGCLNKAGSVKITDISPVGETGMKVTGWAIRPNPFWRPSAPNPANVRGQIGVARASLSRLAFPASTTIPAAAECGDKGEGYEFAVQVEKTTSGEAGASGWVVTYTSDGDTKKFGFTLAVRLCNEASADAKKCTALKV